MAGSVSPNSNPVQEIVMTVHPLNPIRPNLLSLVNRLLPVLDGTFGHVVGLVLSIRSLVNHAQSISFSQVSKFESASEELNVKLNGFV
ncbi:hypothetical protein V6N12_066532 [Hibiscus sabdariffa]|uniref:Uncharacterized protein n=1 Tax=Hibiscus sabdariffa TaxID=183260 RepID=A0ABR2CQD9_9ROSI